MALRVKQQMNIRRPVAEVFDALVNPEKLSGYFTSSASGALVEGAQVEWCWADFECDARLAVRVAKVEQDSSVAFRWPATGRDTLVEFTFEPVSDSVTKVTVEEGNWEMTEEGVKSFVGQAEGWIHMTTCMKAWLEYGGINLRKGMS